MLHRDYYETEESFVFGIINLLVNIGVVLGCMAFLGLIVALMLFVV